MTSDSDNLFALPDVQPLLRAGLMRVPLAAARQPAGRALIVQACPANRDLPIDVRSLESVRLHVRAAEYAGDVLCAVDTLPWEDGAFRLVVAQHVGDALPGTIDCVSELARVLAPGGSLLWFGLNPWSPWRVWAFWQGRRRLLAAPRPLRVDVMRRRLLQHRLALSGLDHIGSCWPWRAGIATFDRSGWLARMRGVYLITATRQRAAMTPARPLAVRERVSMQPPLAIPTRRASA